MASEKVKIVLDSNGLDQIAAIIAHLKNENDQLRDALTSVQEECTRQLEELRLFRLANGAPQEVVVTIDSEEVMRAAVPRWHRGGYAGAQQE